MDRDPMSNARVAKARRTSNAIWRTHDEHINCSDLGYSTAEAG